MSQSGRFITFEGSEGVGKTTQIQNLARWFEDRGREVVLTREPGGTELAERVRELVLDKSLPAMASDTELLLIYAARAEHVVRVIKPALATGKIVISDRFADASFAYQGYGRGISIERLKHLHHWVLKDFSPDLTLLLDMPVGEGMARARARSELDRFEQEHLNFFEKVREGYLSIARTEPARVQIVDAGLSEKDVFERIVGVVGQILL